MVSGTVYSQKVWQEVPFSDAIAGAAGTIKMGFLNTAVPGEQGKCVVCVIFSKFMRRQRYKVKLHKNIKALIGS